MTEPTPPSCPDCDGLLMPDHPAGLLAYDHSNACQLRAHEDGQKVADLETALSHGRFERPATATERALLASQGHAVPADLTTVVDFLTRGICHRSWARSGIGDA